jgi:hypothetical protein
MQDGLAAVPFHPAISYHRRPPQWPAVQGRRRLLRTIPNVLTVPKGHSHRSSRLRAAFEPPR